MNLGRRQFWLLTSILALLLWWTGCTTPPPKRPSLDLSPAAPQMTGPTYLTRVELPMKVIGGLVVVETLDKGAPSRFLIDTGASATLASPAFARRHLREPTDPAAPKVWLRDATGRAVPVESAVLDKIDFGPANFQNVRALVFDCQEISDHLGIQIDGVLGFDLFTSARLTLDYPNQRLFLSTLRDPTPLRGTILPFTRQNGVPRIEVTLGRRSLVALLDTGSDGGFNLDPSGLDLAFTATPRPGALVGTLHGDHQQIVARLAGTLRIGDFEVIHPITDLSGNLTSIGGDLLHHFEVTFDPAHGQVAFYRADDTNQFEDPPKLSSGLSFKRSRAYWKVNGVAPDSPAEEAGLKVGDLVIRIQGEAVESWTLERFQALVEAGDAIDYTTLKGREETNVSASTFVLVP